MPATLWPWLALAAAGALHGLNPITGWAYAAWGANPRPGTRCLRMLAPMAVGHLASVLTVAAAVPAALRLGLRLDASLPKTLAAGALLLVLVRHCRDRRTTVGRPARGRSLALWSFIAGTGHGAGLMLAPALSSLCTSRVPAHEITGSGSLGLCVAAVGVHMAAMLLVTAGMVAGARRMAACVRVRTVQSLGA